MILRIKITIILTLTTLFIGNIATAHDEEFSHVKINIFPDGGISRLRIYGFPNWGPAALL